LSKYDKFDKEYLKVPVQFGQLSKRPRRCRNLGYVGALITEPYWIESYYRIDDSEVGGGRFFYVRRWHGDKDGTINPDGKVWQYIRYVPYAWLPDEIKKEIEENTASSEWREEPTDPEHDNW